MKRFSWLGNGLSAHFLNKPAGPASLKRLVQGRRSLFETLEDRLPFALQVSIGFDAITENGVASSATVARTGSLAQPLTVSLASSDPTEAAVPATVVIPANAASATFNISPVDDAIADSRVTVTITASAAGHGQATDTIDVLDDEVFALPIGTQLDVVTVGPGSAGQPFATLGPKQPDIAAPPIDLRANGPGDQRHALSLAHPEQNLVAISTNQRYSMSSWGLIGSNLDDSPFGFASYDADKKLIHPLHVTRHAFAADTTLAAPLLPGAMSLLITNASGWSNEPWETADTRSLAWYGYTNSLGQTYVDYTYTRNVASDFDEGLWDAGAISYDPAAGAYRIQLNQPWSGPALAAGAAVRNAASGRLHSHPGEMPPMQTENAYVQYAADFGGSTWQNGRRDDNLFRPGTAFIQPLVTNSNATGEIVIGPQEDSVFGTPQDPTGQTVEVTGAQQTVIDLDVLAKRAFGGASTVVIDSVLPPRHGTATILPGAGPGGRAVIHYVSSPSFLGTDLIEYTLRNTASGQTQKLAVRVHIVGGELQAAGDVRYVFDSLYRISAGQTLTADGVKQPTLLMNSPGTTTSTVRLVAGTSHGALKLDPDGSFQYTPDFGFTGSDQFRVEVLSPEGRSIVTASINVDASSDDLVLSRLHELGIGMLNYESARNRFPVAGGTTNYFNAGGFPQLSWRVHILPYIGYQSLYSQFRLDEPWNSAHNTPLAAQMPDVFRSADDAASSTSTRFQTIGREGAPYLWRRSSNLLQGPRQQDFTDGLANSLLIVEVGANQAITWTKPDDLDYNPSNPLASLGNFASGGINAVAADGSVVTLPANINAATLHALVTISGGELVDIGTLHRRHQEQSGATPAPSTADAAMDNVLKSIAIAMQSYESAKQSFPIAGPRSYFDAQGNPYLSWRVHLLPYLGYNTFFQKFKLDEPWNSANNLPLLSQMPDIFRSVGDPSTSTTTRIATFYGGDAPFGPINPAITGNALGPRYKDLLDGEQNTIMFVEAGPEAAMEWTRPGGIAFDGANPFAAMGNVADGFRAVTFDSAVLKLPGDLDPSTLAAIVTPDGRELADIGQIHVRELQRTGQLEADFIGHATLNRYKQIVVAMQNHQTSRGRLPANTFNASGQPLLSWRVHILPYLGYNNLYQQFRKDEPWDSPHNLALLDQMPDVFRATDDPWDSVLTRAMTFTGPGAPFPATGTDATRGPSSAIFGDGTSNTIAVIQAGHDAAVPWTKPADAPFDTNNPFSPLGDLGPHLITAMADGSVRRRLSSISPGALKALITHNGDEDPSNPPPLTPGPGITVRQSAGAAEIGEFGVKTFDIVLESPPATSVTLALTSSDPSAATLTHATITFTPANWNVPQRVGLRSIDNQLINPDKTVQITVSVVDNLSDGSYDPLPNQVASTVIVDDDNRPQPPDADFNGDARTDGRDLLAWQRGLGTSSGALKTQGDADGDGVVNAQDLAAWKTQFGSDLSADFDGDRAVGAADLAAWKSGFGTLVAAAAAQGDADRDSDVDGPDLLAWQRGLTGTAPSAATLTAAANASAAFALSSDLLMGRSAPFTGSIGDDDELMELACSPASESIQDDAHALAFASLAAPDLSQASLATGEQPTTEDVSGEHQFHNLAEAMLRSRTHQPLQVRFQ